MIFHIKFGEATMPPVVFNGDCQAAILLDYIRKRVVKDTEAYAREKDAAIRGQSEETAENLANVRAQAEAEEPPEGVPERLAELEKAEALCAAQSEALMAGVGLFKGLQEVDLQDDTGKNLELNKTPKVNAKEVLLHRQTYTVVRIGAPDAPEDVENKEEDQPPAEDAEKAVVSLTFTIPVPEAADEPPPTTGKR